MSATQEALAEDLRVLDSRIAERENAGEDTAQLVEQRRVLMQRLAQANAALNESANILKG